MTSQDPKPTTASATLRASTSATTDRVHLAGCSLVVWRPDADPQDPYVDAETRFTIVGTRGTSLELDGLLVLAWGEVVPAADVVPAGAEWYYQDDAVADRLDEHERRLDAIAKALETMHRANGDDADVILDAIAAASSATAGPKDQLKRFADRIRRAPDVDLADDLRNACGKLSYPVARGWLRAELVVEQLVEAVGDRLNPADVAALVAAALAPPKARRR